jgi:hypothetical protein
LNMDRKTWGKKFQLVKNEWRALRPTERLAGKYVGSKDFLVRFSRSLMDEIEVSYHVSGWKIGTSEWSLRVRVAILDRRVARLRSEVITAHDTSDITTLDFDVIAAAAAIDGRELEPSPSIEPGASDDAVRFLVKDFSDQIDEIWTFARGFTVEGLETLSIWVLRNRNIVGVPQGPPAGVIGVICTAFVYGERELFRELLREYEMQLAKRRCSEVYNEVTQSIHASLGEDVTRLRSLLS